MFILMYDAIHCSIIDCIVLYPSIWLLIDYIVVQYITQKYNTDIPTFQCIKLHSITTYRVKYIALQNNAIHRNTIKYMVYRGSIM